MGRGLEQYIRMICIFTHSLKKKIEIIIVYKVSERKTVPY